MPTLRKRSIWIGVNETIGLAAGIISLFTLVPVLTPAQWGAYGAMFGIVGPIAAFTQSGVVLSVLERILHLEHKSEAVARSSISIVLFLGSLGVPVASAFGYFVIPNLSLWTVIGIAATELLLSASVFTLGAVIQCVDSFENGLAVKIAAVTLRTSVVLGLFFTHTISIPRVVAGHALSMLLVTIGAIIRLHHLGVSTKPTRQVDRADLGRVALYSFGLSASIVQNDGDKVFLQGSGYADDGGRYAVAYRLASIAMLPMTILSTSTHFQTLEESKIEKNPVQKAARYTQIALLVAVPCAIIAFISTFFIPAILGEEYRGSITMLRVLLPVLTIRGLSAFPMNGLLGIDCNSYRTRLLVAGGTVSLVLYAALIPAFSWKGAVLASLIVESLLVATTWKVFKNQVKLKSLDRKPRHAKP